MIIRPAKSDDVTAISELLLNLTKKFIAAEFSDEGKDNILNSLQPDAIQRYFDQGFRFHVGEVEAELIGVVGTRDNSHLYHLFVKEPEQGKGHSKSLWQIAKAACIAAGNDGEFTVNASLNAQNVYKRWGFVPIDGIREGGGVKDIPMKLVL